MAKNWTAYEAAKEIIEGKDKENICEIGSRYPMLTREVAVAGDKILVILKALPKVTARVLETGLKDGVEVETEVEEETKETETEDDELDYTDMTGANLYKLCCARGISSKCKSRKKDALIELLEKFDRGELDEEEPKKETKKASKGKAKKAEPVVEDDDWDTEDEEEKDPYEGKTAMELFKMCKERGIKTKPKQKADAYVKLLKAADAESEAEEVEDDEDDDWEI